MDEDDYIEDEDETVSFDPNEFLKTMRKTLGEYVGLVIRDIYQHSDSNVQYCY